MVIGGRQQRVPPADPQVPPAEAVQPREVANPAIRPYPADADGIGIKRGGYNGSRWAEDWRLMADPKKRNDPLDRLKYLPFNDAGDIYLTLSGEVRLRSNYIGNPGIVESEHRREDMLRLIGGADLHLGDHLRFYGELGHGGISGHNIGTPSAKARNDLILQQAFGEFSGRLDNVDLGVRYGRQEFTDGPPLLVGALDNNTIRTSLDGFRGWAMGSRVRFDVFDFEYIRFGPHGISDDKSNDATRFSGVTMGIMLPKVMEGQLFFDPFVWRERLDAETWAGVTAREERLYTGARLWGDMGPVNIDWTIDHQSGSFGNRDIDAWNFFLAQTYDLGLGGMKPEVGIHFDYGSGGGTYEGGTLKTAATPVGGNIEYSYQGALTITNLFMVAPNVTVTPVKDVKLTLAYNKIWRANSQDAVYRANGKPYAGTQNLSGSDIGQAFRAQASWKISPRLSITGRYEYFAAGDLLTRLNYTDSNYVALWTSFRF
ncbi:MAG: hypothetical protein CMN72_12505 [Sphingomonas sp.]|nr:hypothetical protein [Sphingomonas sp.]